MSVERSETVTALAPAKAGAHGGLSLRRSETVTALAPAKAGAPEGVA